MRILPIVMRFLVTPLAALAAMLLLSGCVAPRGEGKATASDILSVPAPVTTTPAQRAARARPSANISVADFLLVDKSDRLLIAYRAGQPIRAFRSIRFGNAPNGHKRFEGDERTPEGRYYIDTRNPQSRFHLSLRISYPNERDRAFAAQNGRSPGGDIFIHGQPTGYSGPPISHDWTDGCIALTNAEIEELWRIVPDGTPIEIRP